MTDREKVVRAVETCFDSWIDKHRNMGLNLYEVERMKRDALELLKPIEPIEERLNDVDSIYRCGNCKTHFYYRQQKYCAVCGRMAKWDG
jgi:peptide methionine sulfoxide reductase MsrB